MKFTKQKSFFLILFLISTVFVSCKKERQCNCIVGQSYDTFDTYGTKKDAKKQCEEIESMGNYSSCLIDNY